MPIRTFLVEDNAVIRENLTATLEELASVQVVGHASTEKSAVDWLQSNSGAWDLAIVDIFLTRGSGLGVLEATQHQQACRVVVSNYATDDMRRRCAELGADGVFDKSNGIEELLSYCHELADRLQRPH
jgi:DNA-binding NarL/FixJ family response regulator